MSTLAGPLTGTFEALTVTNVSRRRHPPPLEHTFLTVDGADPFSNPPPMSILPLTRERASPPLNKAARRRPGGPMIAGARRDAEIVRHPKDFPKGSMASTLTLFTAIPEAHPNLCCRLFP